VAGAAAGAVADGALAAAAGAVAVAEVEDFPNSTTAAVAEEVEVWRKERLLSSMSAGIISRMRPVGLERRAGKKWFLGHYFSNTSIAISCYCIHVTTQFTRCVPPLFLACSLITINRSSHHIQFAFSIPAHPGQPIKSMAVFNLPEGPKILTSSIDMTIRVSIGLHNTTWRSL
jgi:hypothetical protein